LDTRRLCEVAAEVTGLSGAGIMLMSGDFPVGSICTSDPVSRVIEDLQYLLGEGPCIDAFHQQRVVAEPDLAHQREPRWLAFTAAAVDAGARAVFGFPLEVGAVRLGALNLYRDAEGPLTDDQHADALALADVAARAVLVLQSGAPPGMLAAELEAGGEFHYVVHQAAGMVAAQLGISVARALVHLRANAFGNGRDLVDVANEIVNGTLRLSEPDEPEESDGSNSGN
jgi:hypothetical protein